MAAFTFNIAKGRIVELFLSAARGQIVLLQQAESNSVLRDYDTLSAILASPGNVELAHASYARKTGLGATVVIDDVLDQMRVDIAPQTFAALQGSPVVKALVCYQEQVSGVVIPLTGHDWAVSPDGSDLLFRYLASYYTARSISTIQVPVGQPLEADSAFPATRSKLKVVGQPAEADTAQTIREYRDKYLTVPATLSAAEGTSAVVTVTSSRSFVTDTQIFFTLTGVNGAVAGVDFTTVSSPITLLAGQTAVNLTIPILADGVTDPNEIVRVTWTGVVSQ